MSRMARKREQANFKRSRLRDELGRGGVRHRKGGKGNSTTLRSGTSANNNIESKERRKIVEQNCGEKNRQHLNIQERRSNKRGRSSKRKGNFVRLASRG